MRSKDHNLMERILEYINSHVVESCGQPPTTREIGAKFCISHVTAHRYLIAMDELKMLRYTDGKICTEIMDKFDSSYRTVGVIDASVPAGAPDMVDDAYVEEYVSLPSSFLRGLKGKFYSMTVRGESMISAGMGDGDLVIFKEDNQPDDNDIVVAYIDGEGNTLKRFRTDKKGAYLWAENDTWSNKKRMFGRKFTVRGIAVKVLKDL